MNAVHKKVLQEPKHRARFEFSVFDGSNDVIADSVMVAAAEGAGGGDGDDITAWEESFDEESGNPYWVHIKSGSVFDCQYTAMQHRCSESSLITAHSFFLFCALCLWFI